MSNIKLKMRVKGKSSSPGKFEVRSIAEDITNPPKIDRARAPSKLTVGFPGSSVGASGSVSRRRRGIDAADINRLRLPLPDCALPGRSAGRAQQRQRVDHSDDRNHREGQCQSPITPHAARGHQLRKAQVGDHVRCQECR